MLCIGAITTRDETSPVKWYSEFDIDNPICYDCRTYATLFYLVEEQAMDGTYRYVAISACERHKLGDKNEFNILGRYVDVGARPITLDELMVIVTMEE